MKRIFIDGLSGMAQGLFATLIIGTIIQQIGMFVGGNYGDLIYLIGKSCCSTYRSRYWCRSGKEAGGSAACYSLCSCCRYDRSIQQEKILAGQVLVDGNIVLAEWGTTGSFRGSLCGN